MIPFGFPPSRRSRDLAREIFRLIQEYQTLNPDMPDREILAAIRIVESEAGGSTRLMAIALFIALLAACGLAVYFIIEM